MGEQLFALGQLHDTALVDDGDAVTNKTHHRQVVGNEQVGQAPFLLQAGQQVEHLRTDGNIQRRDGLVRHDEFGVQNQRTGDADALALTAGKLMGKPAGKFRQKTHIGQRLVHHIAALFLGIVPSRRVKPLRHDVAHLGPLVEGIHGVLKNHLYIAGDLTVLGGGQLAGDALAVQANLACRQRVGPDDGPADSGLAGAGFPHQAKGLSFINGKGNIVHRHEGVPFFAEFHPDVVHFQHFFTFSHWRTPPLSSAPAGGPFPAARGYAPAGRFWVRGGPAAMCAPRGWPSRRTSADV